MYSAWVASAPQGNRGSASVSGRPVQPVPVDDLERVVAVYELKGGKMAKKDKKKDQSALISAVGTLLIGLAALVSAIGDLIR